MSWLDVTLLAGFATLAGCAGWLLVRRLRLARAEVDQLRRELAVFAEASTRVADTLDRVLQSQNSPTETIHSSRRYLISEAQKAVGNGEPLESVAARLKLSHDEVRLLRYTRGGRSSRSWAA